MRTLLLVLLLAACRREPPKDVDGDGSAGLSDCDEGDASIYGGAVEICDGIDQDCDGTVDEDAADMATFYADSDGDGWGDAGSSTTACDAPDGFVTDSTDCDDLLADVNPAAEEHCDGIDDDCDGLVDESGTEVTWYLDADGDGYGDPTATMVSCEAPEGYVADATDCDDALADVHPDAAEVCNGLDDDCDGVVDTDAGDLSTFYADTDGDGYGDSASVVTACDAPEGYSAVAGDCDDADPAWHPDAAEDDCNDPNDYNCDGSVGWADADGDGWAACEDCDDSAVTSFPGATETCDGRDQDCDGTTDEDAVDAGDWYADTDSDGYGDVTSATSACDAPAGYVADDTDCDDTDGDTNPGAPEVCDGEDDDCDGAIDEGTEGTWYADTDGDGYGDASSATDACDAPAGYVADATDCDDGDAESNPGAAEVCDAADNDCDGSVDEGVGSSWYADSDGDGYGDAASVVTACDAPAGYVADDTDCDDGDADTRPGAVEVCDAIDNDCDGSIDEGLSGTWYADDDGDGYGDPASTAAACSAPSGYVSDDTDCDDADGDVHPGAAEACDGVDNDCDGSIDEDLSGTWYADDDGDGYGDPDVSTTAGCTAPSGYVADDSDCDDGDPATNPAAIDDCDTLDNDCSGDADDGGLCPCDVDYYNDEPYMFCTTAAVWETARNECLTYGYDLVALGDATEEAWVISTARSAGMASNAHFTWIGLNDRSVEGTFVWSNGEAVTYTNWTAGEPNNSGNEDCAHIWSSGTWNDIPCTGYPTPYVCEP